MRFNRIRFNRMDLKSQTIVGRRKKERSHKGEILPLRNRVIPIDNRTVFLAHYDITVNDVLRGIPPLEDPVYTLVKDGYFGGGVALEEKTTNLMPLTTEWIRHGTSIDKMSENSYRIKRIDDTSYPRIRSSEIGADPNGGSITVSCEILDFTISTEGQFGITFSNTTESSNGKSWYFPIEKKGRFVATLDYTSTDLHDGSSSMGDIFMWLVMYDSSIGEYVDIKNFQVEQKSFATSFTEESRPSSNLNYPEEIFPIESEGTFSCWAKTHQEAANKTIFLEWDTTEDPESRFGLRMNYEGRIEATFGDSNFPLVTERIYNDGEWHQYVLTWINGTSEIHLYVDGEKVASDTIPRTIQNIGGRKFGYIGIGREGSTYNTNHWNGVIDELRIDNVARTEDEIRAWYFSNSPFYPKGIYKVSY